MEKREKKPSRSEKVYRMTQEKPISEVYSTIDNELACDNLENDIPAADLQDL